MKFRHFSIRDLLWLTALCAVLVAWRVDRNRSASVISSQQETIASQAIRLRRADELVIQTMSMDPSSSTIQPVPGRYLGPLYQRVED
jgi:hypothetical protein